MATKKSESDMLNKYLGKGKFVEKHVLDSGYKVELYDNRVIINDKNDATVLDESLFEFDFNTNMPLIGWSTYSIAGIGEHKITPRDKDFINLLSKYQMEAVDRWDSIISLYKKYIKRKWDEAAGVSGKSFKIKSKDYKQIIIGDQSICFSKKTPKDTNIVAKYKYTDEIEIDEFYQIIDIIKNDKFKIEYEKEIPFSDLEYYDLKGNLTYTTQVTGTGGGVNKKNAVVGGVLFGDAGAIVGSKVGQEIKVTSKEVKKDSRYTEVVYNDSGEIKVCSLPAEAYEVLKQNCPQKDVAYVQAHASSFSRKTETIDPFEKLTKLKEMLEAELITQEDFEEQKQRILNNM